MLLMGKGPPMKEQARPAPTWAQRPGVRLARNPLQRALYMSAGTVSLALATLGLFIRGLLPTTPFLLLAAYCYGRSSPRMYHWIYTHRVFGPILVDWEDHRSLSRRTKAVGIASVWIGILLSIVILQFTAPPARLGYLQALLVLVATSVTVFLATRPTATRTDDPEVVRYLGPGLHAKTLTIGVLWTGLIACATILHLQAPAVPPLGYITPLAIGLTVTPLVATARREPLPRRRRWKPSKDRETSTILSS